MEEAAAVRGTDHGGERIEALAPRVARYGGKVTAVALRRDAGLRLPAAGVRVPHVGIDHCPANRPQILPFDRFFC
jgi:hypothetical protein